MKHIPYFIFAILFITLPHCGPQDVDYDRTAPEFIESQNEEKSICDVNAFLSADCVDAITQEEEKKKKEEEERNKPAVDPEETEGTETPPTTPALVDDVKNEEDDLAL